jgi:hypothetical protein
VVRDEACFNARNATAASLALATSLATSERVCAVHVQTYLHSLTGLASRHAREAASLLGV